MIPRSTRNLVRSRSLHLFDLEDSIVVSLVVATPDAMVDSSLRSPIAHHNAKATNFVLNITAYCNIEIIIESPLTGCPLQGILLAF